MHINSIVSKIIADRIPCCFISPHMDDAVFSAGRLLLLLSSKTAITIVTVFTEGSPPPYTLSAKAGLIKNGVYQSALDFFYKRRLEDEEACNALKAKRMHLGFIDASYRKKRNGSEKEKFFDKIIPELNHLYPFYRLNVVSGKISFGDRDILSGIEKKLQALKEAKGALVFCPLGVGGHVDHIIVRNICEKIFTNLIFWNDYPYHLKAKKGDKIDLKLNLGILENKAFTGKKRGIMSIYKSQTDKAFLDNSESVPESYYAAFPKFDIFPDNKTDLDVNK